MARISFICGRCRTYQKGSGPCLPCSETKSRSKYAGVQIGMIDGEHSGYFPKEWGLPPDPTNPLKSIMPPKRRAEDGLKRIEEKSGGAFGFVKP